MNAAGARSDDFATYGSEFVERGGESAPPAQRRRPTTLVRAFGGAGAAGADGRIGTAGRLADRSPRHESRRWANFLALAEAHGVSADEVAARFTGDDIADLCAPEHDEAMLARCMSTLAEAVRRDRAVSPAAPRWEKSPVKPRATAGMARQVRCGDCRHFRRRASHPHLGECAEGVSRTAAGGFWDDQKRSCEAFVPCEPSTRVARRVRER